MIALEKEFPFQLLGIISAHRFILENVLAIKTSPIFEAAKGCGCCTSICPCAKKVPFRIAIGMLINVLTLVPVKVLKEFGHLQCFTVFWQHSFGFVNSYYLTQHSKWSKHYAFREFMLQFGWVVFMAKKNSRDGSKASTLLFSGLAE